MYAIRSYYDLGLAYSVQVVFDGVLDGQYVTIPGVDLGQGRIQGGGLARAGGSGDQQDAVGLADKLGQQLAIAGCHAQRNNFV